MKCEDYLELLSPYLDQQLTTQEVEELEAHLKTCKSCREELEILEAIGITLDGLKDKEVPQGFHTELMNKINAQKQIKPFYHHKFFMYGSSIAAVFILVIIFSQGLNFENSSEQDQAEIKVMMSAMPEGASYEKPPVDSVGMVQEPNGLGRAVLEEQVPMVDEWYLVSEDGEKTTKLIEEWAKSNQYQIQTIIQGEERKVAFLETVDREGLKSLLEKQGNIQDFKWIEMKNQDLVIIITQYNP